MPVHWEKRLTGCKSPLLNFYVFLRLAKYFWMRLYEAGVVTAWLLEALPGGWSDT